jgi:hypothetical protein
MGTQKRVREHQGARQLAVGVPCSGLIGLNNLIFVKVCVFLNWCTHFHILELIVRQQQSE